MLLYKCFFNSEIEKPRNHIDIDIDISKLHLYLLENIKDYNKKIEKLKR